MAKATSPTRAMAHNKPHPPHHHHHHHQATTARDERDSGDGAHDPHQLLIEKRLHSSRTTHRLDLSTPLTHLPSLPRYQLFPRQIISHEHSGHHLRELWLTNHHIAAVPPEIGQFSRLRVLGLGGNALTALPEEIAHLTALEALYLERNQLTVIPKDVSLPRQLRDLRLDGNALTSFPVQVTALRLLHRLGLSHNRLSSVPHEIRRLINLTELDLDHNRIGPTLPDDDFVYLQKLERLGLDGNQLEARPACFSRMPRLQFIRINGNRSADYLPIDTASGQRLDGPTVPRRHDSYYQCLQTREPSDKQKTTSRVGVPAPPPLDGVVPCREQNLRNVLHDHEQRHLKGYLLG